MYPLVGCGWTECTAVHRGCMVLRAVSAPLPLPLVGSTDMVMTAEPPTETAAISTLPSSGVSKTCTVPYSMLDLTPPSTLMAFADVTSSEASNASPSVVVVRMVLTWIPTTAMLFDEAIMGSPSSLTYPTRTAPLLIPNTLAAPPPLALASERSALAESVPIDAPVLPSYNVTTSSLPSAEVTAPITSTLSAPHWTVVPNTFGSAVLLPVVAALAVVVGAGTSNISTPSPSDQPRSEPLLSRVYTIAWSFDAYAA
mmetsp:Transcript_31633/g.68423  ORF Transcript_31633/g.68423 Transcript_31633/m.68423 type:complete len:255 (+) Transcript_31633:1798-2562(+)